MAYEADNITDPDRIKKQGCQSPPFGPGFTEEQVEGAIRLRIMFSSVHDSGSDYVDFILTTKDGNKLTKRIGGY
jgi:hypothetical protein